MFLSNLILLFILGLDRIVCHLLFGLLTRLFDFAIPLPKDPITWKFEISSAIIGIGRGRDAGVVERGGLENRCGLLGHRGFESLSLRKKRLFS